VDNTLAMLKTHLAAPLLGVLPYLPITDFEFLAGQLDVTYLKCLLVSYQ
jgi:hypothetical protein